jgi:hypothetical protein
MTGGKAASLPARILQHSLPIMLPYIRNDLHFIAPWTFRQVSAVTTASMTSRQASNFSIAPWTFRLAQPYFGTTMET